MEWDALVVSILCPAAGVLYSLGLSKHIKICAVPISKKKRNSYKSTHLCTILYMFLVYRMMTPFFINASLNPILVELSPRPLTFVLFQLNTYVESSIVDVSLHLLLRWHI
jgi:hypothetical protein